ncbi:glycosyltransferase family 4 protein [Geminicoccaceae bacterium 1502E]|nr:glycosyltransferase family 4 protein [Geminicoccaceae bacterium 1502E]
MSAMIDEQPSAVASLGGRHASRLHALQLGMRWGQAPGAGGLDRVFTDLVRLLPEAGVDTEAVVEGPTDAGVWSGARVHSFAPRPTILPRRYAAARQVIRDVLQGGTFDLVAVHFALHAALALGGRVRCPLPLVAHFHGPWSLEARQEGEGPLVVAAKHRVEGAVYRRAARVIVLSRAFGDLVVRTFGVDAERVRLVPGHVDLARFARMPPRADARRMLGLPGDRPIVLTVRRLSRRMGLERLVAAMAEVVRAVPDILLCIAGKGALGAELERRVREAGLERHVRFLGFVPDERLALLYGAADLSVVPTVALEGFGLVAAESLAAGTPALVTPVGGLPEVVAPLSAELLLQSAEAADIAAGLVAALRGTRRLPDASACRSYAAARFPVSLAVSRVAAVYREVA